MFRIFPPLLLALSLTIFFAGCDTREEQGPPISSDQPSQQKTTPATTTTIIPFREPIQPAVYELPSGALASWKNFTSAKPALILYANHPFLVPLKDEERATSLALLAEGDDGEIVRRGSGRVPDPAFLPPQTVSVAIESGLISELVYVFPSKRTIEDFSLPEFQQRAYRAGFLTEEEASALTIKDGVISGTVRSIPFRCVHPDALFEIHKPLIVHIDLGYFNDLYVNGVKTRPYDLLYDLVRSIQDKDFPALAVTLSYSNREVGFSLESRFVISNLAEILRRPELLGGDTPASWALRSNALYYAEMFNEEESKKLTRKAAEANPGDPAALFALSMLELQEKNSSTGFNILDQAVALDKGYANAYIELAEQGLKIEAYNKSIELLQKAATIFPEDAFIRIHLADILIQHGHAKEARSHIDSLRALPWSVHYHPEMQSTLAQMADAAADESTRLLPKTPRDSVQKKIPSPSSAPFHMGDHQRGSN